MLSPCGVTEGAVVSFLERDVAAIYAGDILNAAFPFHRYINTPGGTLAGL